MGNSLGLISKAAMFGVANDVFNKRLKWRTANTDQQKWFEQYLPVYLDQVLPRFPGKVESVASNQCDVVNAFIERKQMQVRLRDMGPANLYIASYAEQAFKWLTEGVDVTRMWGEGFEAYSLEGNEVDLYKVDGREIFIITVSDGFRIMIARHDFPLAGLAMLDDAVKVASETVRRNQKSFYDVLWMPSLKVDVMPDISYLIGACPKAPSFPIGQAVQQVKWKLDRIGFEQKEISGMMMRKGAPTVRKIDYNFTMSVWYKDLPLPTAVSWVDANDRVRVGGNQPEMLRRRGEFDVERGG